MTERQRYTVVDENRSLVFNGTLLGYASSAGDRKNRWTEMTIYLTEEGRYIVSGVGQSTVKKGDWVRDKFTGKPFQAPEDETTRSWCHVCDTAEGAVAALHMKDSDGVRYMTRIARMALEAAILQDKALADAFLVEKIA